MNDNPRKFFCITACQVDYQPNIACFNGIVSRVVSFRHFSAIFIRYILCWISVVNGWAVSYSILMTLKCLARSKQIWYTCTFTSFAICAAKPSMIFAYWAGNDRWKYPQDISWWWRDIITAKLHESHGVSVNWQLDSLINSLFRLTMKHQCPVLLPLCENQGTCDVKSVFIP